MKLEDALFNWLQIERVAQARPEDEAALDTRDFFLQVLREDHDINKVSVTSEDATMVYVRIEKEGGSSKLFFFDREAADQLVNDVYNDRCQS